MLQILITSPFPPQLTTARALYSPRIYFWNWKKEKIQRLKFIGLPSLSLPPSNRLVRVSAETNSDYTINSRRLKGLANTSVQLSVCPSPRPRDYPVCNLKLSVSSSRGRCCILIFFICYFFSLALPIYRRVGWNWYLRTPRFFFSGFGIRSGKVQGMY